jgi:hypothetical protein
LDTAVRLGLALGVLAGLLGTSPAGAQSPCGALGGTVNSDQTCDVHDAGDGYTVDLSFPVDYPDQQSLGAFLIPLHDDFIEVATLPRVYDNPYALTATPTTYRSGGVGGTHSVVLALSQDINPHPVAWYKAFTYDLGAQAPITLDNLFKPGTKPLDIVFPAVRRELEKRWAPLELASMLGPVEEATFRNFALTDDAVIFFIGQGQLLGHPEGPLKVSVPRTDLAPSLA